MNGKRQGFTSKKLNTPHAALAVSKYKLFQLFLETVELKSDLWNIYKHLGSMTYLDVKHLSLDYQIAWNELKAMYFKQWTHKPPDLLAFFSEANAIKSDQK